MNGLLKENASVSAFGLQPITTFCFGYQVIRCLGKIFFEKYPLTKHIFVFESAGIAA